MIDQFKTYLILQNLSSRTIESYIKTITYFLNENIFESESKMLTWFQIKKQNKSGNYFNKLLAVLRRFTDWAVSEEHLNKWVSKHAHNTLKTIPRNKIKNVLDLFAYTDDQQQSIIESCSGWTLKAIFWIPLKTGIRSRTLFNLELDDIVDNGFEIGINVRPEIDKTWNGRFIPITDRENQRWLRNYLKYRQIMDNSSDKLIHLVNSRGEITKFKGGTRSRLYKLLSDEVGFRVALHNCRYTFAVNVWKQTGDIYLCQYLLGHSNVQQTIEYLKITEREMRSQVVRKMQGVVL